MFSKQTVQNEVDGPSTENEEKDEQGKKSFGLNMFTKPNEKEEGNGNEGKKFGLNMFSKKADNQAANEEDGEKEKGIKPSFGLRNPFMKAKVASSDDSSCEKEDSEKDEASANPAIEEPGENKLMNKMKNPFSGLTMKGKSDGVNKESTSSTISPISNISMSNMLPKRLTRKSETVGEPESLEKRKESSFAPISNAFGRKKTYSESEVYISFDESPDMFEKKQLVGEQNLDNNPSIGPSDKSEDDKPMFPIRAKPSSLEVDGVVVLEETSVGSGSMSPPNVP